jgi:energy-coupling factor transporter ATP-binding protein EcfA2
VQLENALATLPGGYIAVLGTPGSGKSTLLTQVLRAYQAHVIRYYAYVPDAQDPTVLRGEAINFLHDVGLAIEEAGFRVGASPSHFDRDDLLARFHQQLQRLHQDCQSSGRKTIVLIDGLDHIAREQNPDRSLLLDLPPPDAVPDGVYMVLGCQTDAPFSDRVQAAVRRPERRIEMAPLSRQAVMHIVEQAGCSVTPSPKQREQIHRLSAGHPLALSCLINHLQDATDDASIDTILSNTDRYEGSIEAQYHSYWS